MRNNSFYKCGLIVRVGLKVFKIFSFSMKGVIFFFFIWRYFDSFYCYGELGCNIIIVVMSIFVEGRFVFEIILYLKFILEES